MAQDTVPELTFTKEVTYHYEYKGVVKELDYYINEFEKVRSYRDPDTGNMVLTTFPKTNTPYQVIVPELVAQVVDEQEGYTHTLLLHYLPDVDRYVRTDYIEVWKQQYNPDTEQWEYVYDEEGNRVIDHIEFYPDIQNLIGY